MNSSIKELRRHFISHSEECDGRFNTIKDDISKILERIDKLECLMNINCQEMRNFNDALAILKNEWVEENAQRTEGQI